MFLDIDLSLTPQKPKLYLCKPNKTIIASLKEHCSANLRMNLTTLSELTFNLPYQIEKNNEQQYNTHCTMLKNRYLIKLVLGEYIAFFIIDNPSPNADDSTDFLQVNCYSLEYELRDKNLRVYKVDAVLLSEVMNGFTRNVDTIPILTDGILKETAWALGEFPIENTSIYRSFEVSIKTKFDFILEVADKFNLIAKFNSINRTINFYPINEYGVSKGFRITDIKYLRTIVQNIDSEFFCTRLKVYGKDGLTINSISPNGMSYIEDYSYFLFPFQRDEITREVISHSDYMTDALCHAILDYQILLSQNADGFATLLADLTALQITLTSLNNEMTVLTDEMAIIDDNIKTAQDLGQSTTTLIAEKVAKQVEIDAKQSEIDAVNVQIAGVQASITEIQTTMSVETYFAPELLSELQTSYQIDKDWNNDSILTATDLYLYGLDEMQIRKSPKTVIQISIVNFLEILEEQRNWDKINLGDSIAIEHEQLGIDLTAKIISINFDFENADIQLTISNVKTASQRLSDSLYHTSSYVNIIDTNKLKWNESENNATNYIDQQINELNGTLSNLNIDVNKFSQDGYITRSESNALKNSLKQMQAESEDFVNIAISLGIITETEKYNTDLTNLENELLQWIDQPATSYPITLLTTERGHLTTLFRDVQDSKAKLINQIAIIRENNANEYADEQVSEVNISIANMLTNIADFAKDKQITYDESVALTNSFNKIMTESNDVINIANALEIDTALITNYTNSLTGTVASCGIDGLEVELNKWVGFLELDYPKPMSSSQKKALVGKFVLVNSTKKLLFDAISLKTPEYSIDGEMSVRGTGANRNSARILKINKKSISASSVSGRGLMLTVISREDLSIIFTQLYDTFNSDNVGKNALATKLDTLDDTVIVVLTSYDSIGWNSTLLTSIIRCGGSGVDTGTGKFPFALVGIPGLFKGSALEVFSNSASNAPYADINTKIIDGLPQGIAIGTSVISAEATLAVQTAIAEADIANADIANIASNTTVTAKEKKTVKKYWDLIVNEKADVELQASYYNTSNYPDIVSTLASYETAYSNLNTYLNVSIAPPNFYPILYDLTVSSTIVSATFINKFKAYYDAKIALLTAIMGVARDYIGDAVAGLAESIVGLAGTINSVTLDGIITQKESVDLETSLNTLIAESVPFIDLATQLGISTEKTDYQTALTNLQDELNNWINQALSLYPITINADQRLSIQTNFSAVQSTKSLLLNKISTVQLDNANNNAAQQIMDFNDTVIADLQAQVDGKIEVWFSGYLPSLTNSPANAWTKVTLKDAHLGDYFYNTASGLAYEFSFSTEYSWIQITDSDIVTALYNASIAPDTADGKRRIFTQVPTPPYDISDLWSQGTSGDLMICITKKSLGSSYSLSDWVKSSKYTDDTVANQAKALAEQAQEDATAALDNLSDIANDNRITKDEKVKILKPIWDNIVTEKTNLDAGALLYPSATMTILYDAYTDSYDDLDTYLNTTILAGNVTAILVDLTTKSIIVRSDFNTKFNAYYSAKNVLLNFIASSQKDSVDNIKIGGRNLLLDSGFELGTASLWPTANMVGTFEAGNNSVKSLAIYGTSSADRYYAFAITKPPAGMYMMSYDIKSNLANKTILSVPAIVEGGGSFRVFGSANISNPIPTDWTRISFPVIVPSDCSTTHLWFIMRPNTDVSSGSVFYDNLKFELGNKVTDWTPAIEDVQAEIDATNALLAEIADDNKITPDEKQTVQKEWNIITGEKTLIETQAGYYYITTEKTNYTNAYDALNNYLNVTIISPNTTTLMASLSTTSVIVSADFRNNFTNYYNAKMTLSNKIASFITTPEVYIPLYYPAFNSYISSSTYAYKAINIGSNTLTSADIGSLTSANILHKVSPSWPSGTLFALEAIFSSSSSTDAAWVNLINPAVGFDVVASISTIITTPTKLRSTSFSLDANTELVVAILPADGYNIKLYRADLVVITK